MRDVGKLIQAARRLVCQTPSAAVWQRVEEAAKKPEPAGEAQIAFWTYHVTGNDMSPMFSAMLSHQAAMCFKFSPGSRHSVVFGDSEAGLNMFERCLAMCAYVHSPAFNAPTVFLDTDAFPNGNLRPALDMITDVGLTVRDEPGLMPVNEGVIFAQPTDAARAFFKSYLATYEALREMLDENDWLWWGGQLALNAISGLLEGVPSELQMVIQDEDHDWEILTLHCNDYNFSPDMSRRYTRAELDEKLVLHAKGPRKVLFDQIKAYQEAR